MTGHQIGPVELFARAKWLEERLDRLPENTVSFLTDRDGWEAEKRAYLDELEMLRLDIEQLDPPGRFSFTNGNNVLSMMGVRATRTQEGAAVFFAWVMRARNASTDPKRQAA